MYFANQKARRLSVVEVEQFRKARQVLGQVDLLGAWDDSGDAPCEPSEGGECAFQAGRDCVCAELRHFVQPLVHVGEVLREDLSLQVPPDPHRGEVGAREDERGHVAYARVGHHADVLEAVLLLDEPDGLLDAPAAEVALDDPPLGLERRVDRERRQEHHRLLAEAFDDDEVQILVGEHRQPDRHRAEGYLDVAFLAVGVERDVVVVLHGAALRKESDLVQAVPREHASRLYAHDEVPAFLDEIPVECGSVAASVVDDDALAARRLEYVVDDLQHFVVLALEARRARRPELEREGDRLPRPARAGRGDAPVVAVDDDVASFL